MEWNAIPDHTKLYASDFIGFLPQEEDTGNYIPNCISRSGYVLFTDGVEIYFGRCYYEWDDAENKTESLQWHSYDWQIENVTHWGHLPELPG